MSDVIEDAVTRLNASLQTAAAGWHYRPAHRGPEKSRYKFRSTASPPFRLYYRCKIVK